MALFLFVLHEVKGTVCRQKHGMRKKCSTKQRQRIMASNNYNPIIKDVGRGYYCWMPLSSAFAHTAPLFLMPYILAFASILFFYIFEGSPSYVQTHSSFGESPILWKKHIQSYITHHSMVEYTLYVIPT